MTALKNQPIQDRAQSSTIKAVYEERTPAREFSARSGAGGGGA